MEGREIAAPGWHPGAGESEASARHSTDPSAPSATRPHRAKLKRAVEVGFRPKTEKHPEGRYRADHWGAPASDHAIRRYETADLPRLVREAVTLTVSRAERITIARAAKPPRAGAAEGRAG